MPDAILTKPGRLDREEYELIKRHSDEGAQIVGKLGRLRDAVPMIRHHHERWDGRGYPDGLAGDAIPLEAAIVGLADAWDAMTTDRPYARALTLEEAHAEIRDGRGTQFRPAVVDAFIAAARLRPAEFCTGDAVRRARSDRRRVLDPSYGRTSTWPGTIVAPASPFRCLISQIPSRGSE